MKRRALHLALVAALAAILVATLTPGDERQVADLSTCIVCGDQGAADAISNVILFFPLGVVLALEGVRRYRAWMLGAALSALVEFAQLVVIPGRDPSIGDVTFNTIGTIIGFAAGAYWLRSFPRLPMPRARWATAVAVLLAAIAVALTGYFMQPSYPDTVYYGQWTPVLGQFEWYRGRVLGVRLGDDALPGERLSDSRHVATLLRSGAPLHVLGIAGPKVPPPGLAPLFSIFDDRQQEILLVGPDRDDLVFRYRVRSLDWRLDRPSLRLPNAFAHLSPGDTIDLRLRRDGRTYCLSLNAAQRCGAGYTAGIGWAFLYYPSSFTSWMRITMNALWVGGLLLIVGWAAVDWPTRLLGAAGGAAVLALLPPVVGLAPTTGAEWLGAIVGILLGSLAHPLPGAQRTE